MKDKAERQRLLRRDNDLRPLDRDPPAGGLGWRTWHAYPQTNELVLTETVVALR